MKIGINGASGNVGAAVVGYLKERVPAADIVAISRTPASVEALGVEARFGDYDQPDSLALAYKGLDRLLLIPTSDLRHGARGRQTVGAVEAAAAAGVGHTIFISTLGARAAEEPHVWGGYFATEQALMRQAPKWTVLRMGYYIESLIEEAKMFVPGGVHRGLSDAPVTFVSRDDLAAAAAGILATEGHAGAIYQATGPETLTGTRRAAAIAGATQMPFVFEKVSEAEYAESLRGMGWPGDVVNLMVALQQAFAAGAFNIVSGDIELLSGRKPKSLRQMLAEAFP